MSKSRQKEYMELRKQGLSYKEIGKMFGVTAGTVHATVHRIYVRPYASKVWIYPNIRKWAEDNETGTVKMARTIGVAQPTMTNILTGNNLNPTKRIIDAILAMTGLPYEVAFAEEIKTPGDGGKEISA